MGEPKIWLSYFPNPLIIPQQKFAQMITSGISPDVQNLVKIRLRGCFPTNRWNITSAWLFVPFLSFPFYAQKQLLLSACLSHRNSLHPCPSVRPFVCSSVRLSVTRVDQSKAVQARITKSSPSAARKTLVSGTVKLFHKFEGPVTPNKGAKWEGVGKMRFLANKSLYFSNSAI